MKLFLHSDLDLRLILKLYLQINLLFIVIFLKFISKMKLETVKLHDAHIDKNEPQGFILLCEHASNFIPAELSDLGVDEATKNSHAAWDLGALAMAKLMMEKLNSPLIAQQVSRLVYDCNRPPHEPSAMPKKSEIYEIAGNVNLSQAERDERTSLYYKPFNEMMKQCVSNELESKNQPIIVTIHSFTRSYFGKDRHVEIGILHDEDARYSDAILEVAKNDGDFELKRNEPYGPEDGVTHSLKEYAQPHGLHNVMIEVCNDLIANDEAQEMMAEKLAVYLLAAQKIVEGK